ncbi:hypothetical protein Droror1_Dr00023423, partial [Drosera rotundifolia]
MAVSRSSDNTPGGANKDAPLWNYRGMGNSSIVGTLKLLLELENPHLVFLSETMLKPKDLKWMKGKIGFRLGVAVDGAGDIGGLWVIQLGHVGSKIHVERESGGDWVLERLDRVVASRAWMHLFPCAQVYNIAISSFDLLAIVIRGLEGNNQSNVLKAKQMLFRYENSWDKDPDCSQIVNNRIHTYHQSKPVKVDVQLAMGTMVDYRNAAARRLNVALGCRNKSEARRLCPPSGRLKVNVDTATRIDGVTSLDSIIWDSNLRLDEGDNIDARKRDKEGLRLWGSSGCFLGGFKRTTVVLDGGGSV